jgi:hypothetical protein
LPARLRTRQIQFLALRQKRASRAFRSPLKRSHKPKQFFKFRPPLAGSGELPAEAKCGKFNGFEGMRFCRLRASGWR